MKDQANIAVEKILDLQKRLADADSELKKQSKSLLQKEHELEVKESNIKHQQHELKRLKADEDVLSDMIREYNGIDIDFSCYW